jgi:hypothetical protein
VEYKTRIGLNTFYVSRTLNHSVQRYYLWRLSSHLYQRLRREGLRTRHTSHNKTPKTVVRRNGIVLFISSSTKECSPLYSVHHKYINYSCTKSADEIKRIIKASMSVSFKHSSYRAESCMKVRDSPGVDYSHQQWLLPSKSLPVCHSYSPSHLIQTIHRLITNK